MSLIISRILHAGYIFTKDQTNVVFDPIFENPFSQNCYAHPSIQFDVETLKKIKFDAVFISHYHDDHFSFESLDYINRDTPLFIYCIHDEIIELIHQFGFKKVLQLEINQTVAIRDIRITPRKALDAHVDCLFQIQIDKLNILNVVDSWIDPDTLQNLAGQKPWNLILWPFQTMREIEVLAPDRAQASDRKLPTEWTEQLQVLEPDFLIPSSCQFKMEEWSWYNQAFFPISYKIFEQEMHKILPNSKVIRLQPSESISYSNNKFEMAKPLNWILPLGPQDEDYEYNPDMVPMLTSEIAKHFTELTLNERKRVLQFCEQELVPLFNSLPLLEDSYFYESRIWILRLWDHSGNKFDYYYEMNKRQLSFASNSQKEPSWVTEIPIQKLYNALERGESLSSLYVRIHNSQFDDLVEDPLLRCLYNGKIASYQKAQLKRLKDLSNS